MDNRINVFNEIVALQVYQNSKNYDQTDSDLSGSHLLYCSELDPLHLSGLVMILEKSEWENKVVCNYELPATNLSTSKNYYKKIPTCRDYELITPPPPTQEKKQKTRVKILPS
jgi:hypothetical protein